MAPELEMAEEPDPCPASTSSVLVDVAVWTVFLHCRAMPNPCIMPALLVRTKNYLGGLFGLKVLNVTLVSSEVYGR